MYSEIGEVVHMIETGENNPRNSEGAFITLNNNNILFVYTKFIGKTAQDNSKACIASVLFDGEEWTDNGVIISPEEHKVKNIMGVSLLRMQNDDIGLFYLVRKGWDDLRMVLRRSKDEGKTWGEPKYCMKHKGYYEVNNDRVIRLKRGRIIIPASFYRFNGKYNPYSFKGTGVFFISDDDGETWKESWNICTMPVQRSMSGLQEPGIVELKTGDLWAWFRTDMGFQYESFSMDCGGTWTPPQPSVFTSPDSPMSMKMIEGNLLAVLNPIPAHFGSQGRRTPLVLAVQDGRKWTGYKYLESIYSTNKGYCYTAIHFDGQDIYFAYSECIYKKNKFDIGKLIIRKL